MAISTEIILIFRAIGTNEKMKPHKSVLLTRRTLEMQAKNFAVYRFLFLIMTIGTLLYSYDYLNATVNFGNISFRHCVCTELGYVTY